MAVFFIEFLWNGEVRLSDEQIEITGEILSRNPLFRKLWRRREPKREHVGI